MNRKYSNRNIIFISIHSLFIVFLRSTELKVDEQKSKPTSTEPKPTKVQERECGIQCDVS